MIFKIIPLYFSLKLLWVRWDFHKSEMVYARQADDFVVKNAKSTIFSTSMTSYLKMTSYYDFQLNSIRFFVEIPMD